MRKYPIELVEGIHIFHDDYCDRDRVVLPWSKSRFDSMPSRLNVSVETHGIPPTADLLSLHDLRDTSETDIQPGGHAWWLEHQTKDADDIEPDTTWLCNLYRYRSGEDGNLVNMCEPVEAADLEHFIKVRINPEELKLNRPSFIGG